MLIAFLTSVIKQAITFYTVLAPTTSSAKVESIRIGIAAKVETKNRLRSDDQAFAILKCFLTALKY